MTSFIEIKAFTNGRLVKIVGMPPVDTEIAKRLHICSLSGCKDGGHVLAVFVLTARQREALRLEIEKARAYETNKISNQG